MQIQSLKQSLDITQVAQHLGIEINPKTKRAHCPFHADKTPSLQFSKSKQIATCFSSNCDAGTMDVISLTEKKLSLTTGEAIKYLTKFSGLAAVKPGKPIKTNTTHPYRFGQDKKNRSIPDYEKDFTQMCRTFEKSSIAKDYAKSRHLKKEKLTIGYNAKTNSKFSYLKGCLVFALKDKDGKVVSLYGRSVAADKPASAEATATDKVGNPALSAGLPALSAGRHYYTKERKGLYPNYPAAGTKRLIITESIIDAASLLQFPEITEDYEILALYGTNGYTPEHQSAIIAWIGSLPDPKGREIILWFDGDAAGEAAAKKYKKELETSLNGHTPKSNKTVIRQITTPKGEDINSLLVAKGIGSLLYLIIQSNAIALTQQVKEEKEHFFSSSATGRPVLDTQNPFNLQYQGNAANYKIKGFKHHQLDSLKITLSITIK